MGTGKKVFLDKLKTLADKTGETASYAADAANRKLSDLAATTRINMKIFDLRAESEKIYKEIGQMIYSIHRGAEMLQGAMDAKIAELDEKQEQIAQLQKELSCLKTAVICPCCGQQCSKKDAYCPCCGNAL